MSPQKKFSVLICAVVLAGCANTLEPAPSANTVPGPGEGAMARASGVSMVARAGVWDGNPRNLAQRLTPLRVTFTNNGSVPVRIRYNELMLVAQGRAYKALPPLEIEGTVTRTVTPAYPAAGFGYAPYYHQYLPATSLYSGAFGYSTPYWNRYGPVLRKVDLPTQDMIDRALPEGVIEPGGSVSGFLYFPGIEGDVKRVRLRADLINANNGEALVSLNIPFVVS